MKKKILVYMYSLTGGGAQRTIINIINHINKEKFEVILVLGTKQDNDYLYLVNKDISLNYLDAKNAKQVIKKLRKVILIEEPDMVFSTMNYNNIALALSNLLTFKNIPVVIREANNRTETGGVSRVNKILTYIVYNFLSNKVIALSRGVASDLTTNFKIKDRKVEVIYNPVDTEYIKNKKSDLIPKSSNEFKGKKIISVGRLVTQKDYPTLIQALNIIKESLDVKLYILGKGPEEDKLKKMVKDLDLENNVAFLGFKENPYAYMANADLFILSSRWEGFGHVIVESMAVGTPVLVTDCKSGPREIIGNNEFGRLAPVEDFRAIAANAIELLGDDNLLESYSKLGENRAENFDVKHIVSQYEKVFLKEINN